MANFQASLLADGLPDLVLDCQANTIAGNDDSNYDANTDAGHTRADFSLFRKIFVTTNGGYSYIFSSLGDGQATITPASSDDDAYTYTIANGDGIYAFGLLTIPTLNIDVTYAIGDLVWLPAENAIGQAAPLPVGFDQFFNVITEAQAKQNPKYYFQAQIGDNCNMAGCRDNLTMKAFCVINEDCDCGGCDICSNDSLLKSLEMEVLMNAYTVLSDAQDFTRLQCVFDRANQLCCTPNNISYPDHGCCGG